MISDIRNLDLNLPKALDALLDERSVTHAAARLFLTLTVVSDMVAVVLSRPGKMADGMRIAAPPRAMSGFTKSMVGMNVTIAIRPNNSEGNYCLRLIRESK
ncbi:hypothetical protein electrica_00041 [Klebsiella electrica]|jgi:hypothetical protein|nr:hypothetical protein electrica_00041 [Klebsiella electrica]